MRFALLTTSYGTSGKTSEWVFSSMTIRDRVINAWLAFTGKPSAEDRAASAEVVSLKSELARRGLDLQEAHQTVDALRQQLRELESRTIQESSDGLDALFGALAAPLSQLRLQNSLMEAGKEITGGSVMTLTRNLMNAIESAGLEPIGSCGEEIPFDPEWCGPLSADSSFSPGEAVVIRFVGYRYNDRVIRKALVEEARQ